MLLLCTVLYYCTALQSRVLDTASDLVSNLGQTAVVLTCCRLPRLPPRLHSTVSFPGL